MAALLAFESGWDRERYNAGVIQNSQLTEWARGPVESHYPGYTSWSQLTDEEWEAMSYRSMNSLGFVGYQFGEALLIDLGYYKDNIYYGAGAATNTWDGTWTGKNGVNSLEDFLMKEAQTIAIQEAFGYNLQILQNQLGVYGKSLNDFVGQTRTYVQNGEQVTVDLTLTGILAASHLRGAWGTAALLLDNAVSADENGTSILRYIEQFGGYESPTVETLIGLHKGRVIGDEGLGSLLLARDDENDGTLDADNPPTIPDIVDPIDTSNEVKPEGDGKTIQITYSWGEMTTVEDFDPSKDLLNFGSLPGADVLIEEVGPDLRITVKNNGGSGYLLKGVQAEDLSAANLTAPDWNPVVTQSGGIADQLRALGAAG
ncbi:hypothetical protein [Ensifer sp. YR511]|uniref:hypothetical protein n=1 Tax=Ensifer sp. YR511 TaxID=1855294 RepID=UPI000B7F2B60|nr:hypothetical protein [Ensifer sp. YR511]